MDWIHHLLYWTDTGLDTLSVQSLKNKKHRKTLFYRDLDEPRAIAVDPNMGRLVIDWIHHLLYWTDTGLDTLLVQSLKNNKYRKTLFYRHLDKPKAIAVDPNMGVIFWSDWGKSPRIERASMDGTSRLTIVDQSIKWPNGLTLDLLEQRVYWADAKMKLISSAGYHGEDKRIVLQSWSVLKHPFSLSLFEDRLYWTDWDTEGVHSANKFTGSNVTLVVSGLYGPMSLKVWHPLAQPIGLPDKCQAHSCQHLCLPTSHLHSERDVQRHGAQKPLEFNQLKKARRHQRPYTCHCADGYRLKHNGIGCEVVVHDAPSVTSVRASTTRRQSGRMAAMTIGILSAITIVTVLFGWMIWRRFYQNRTIKTLNFDNPVYRRTIIEADSSEPHTGPAILHHQDHLKLTFEPAIHNNNGRPDDGFGQYEDVDEYCPGSSAGTANSGTAGGGWTNRRSVLREDDEDEDRHLVDELRRLGADAQDDHFTAAISSDKQPLTKSEIV